ncbi:MAG: type II secretion system F family protein [Phycisphaerales bacterium]
MKFTYHAFDRSGKAVTGLVDADDLAQATELLRRQNLFVSKIERGGDGTSALAPRQTRSAGKNLRVVAGFTRQLGVLVSTGTPVVEALGALERQAMDARFKAAVAQLRAKVEEGSSLAAAMEAQPHFFNAVARSLVAAGESSGKLDAMLTRLAELTRQQLRIRTALVGAMVYPCLLMVVALGVLTTMLVFVLPRFTGLFKTLNAPLPPTTKALMAVSEALTGYWFICVPAIVAAIGALVYWLKSPGGRRATDTFSISAPKLSTMTRNFATARLARLIGVLLESKVALLEALELTRQAFSNHHYIEMLRKAQEGVTRGEPLSQSLSASGLVAPSVCEAVRNGERTGQVGRVMLSMADFLDEENDVVVKSLTSILEPVILIVLGTVVGLVATSMFMPLFDLTSMTGPGGGP